MCPRPLRHHPPLNVELAEHLVWPGAEIFLGEAWPHFEDRDVHPAASKPEGYRGSARPPKPITRTSGVEDEQTQGAALAIP